MFKFTISPCYIYGRNVLSSSFGSFMLNIYVYFLPIFTDVYDN